MLKSFQISKPYKWEKVRKYITCKPVESIRILFYDEDLTHVLCPTISRSFNPNAGLQKIINKGIYDVIDHVVIYCSSTNIIIDVGKLIKKCHIDGSDDQYYVPIISEDYNVPEISVMIKDQLEKMQPHCDIYTYYIDESDWFHIINTSDVTISDVQRKMLRIKQRI
jgi:hypothetical protein